MSAHVPAPHADVHDDVVYPGTIPFVLFHLACLGALWSGVTPGAVALGVALYAVRMFAVTAGYHRYFSHRSFKTSRVGQFVLAFLAQTSAQRGAVWWAAKHRAHHRHSDTPLDPHSPRHRGFWFAHVGWIFAPRTLEADYSLVPDLTRYPELVWLDRRKYLPPALLGLVAWLVAGWSGLFVGFVASTVVLYHASFTINSLAHVVGDRPYLTGDDSGNSWWLALLTFGEGWHNNHHHYESSTRQGFRWWQVDLTYYGLVALSWIGVVWDLRVPPPAVVAGAQRPRRTVVERVARDLVQTFPIEAIAREVRAARPAGVRLHDLVAGARARARHALADLHLPGLPSLDAVRTRAREILADRAGLEHVTRRTRELLADAVCARLLGTGPDAATAGI